MSDTIEVLKDMISYRKKGINEFIELHKTGVESILEIEIRTLKKALLALEKQENYVIDFIKLEVLPKSKKEQFRVFFKDGTEQVFEKERVGDKK